MVKTKLTVALSLVVMIAGCVASKHVWVTDMVARNVTPSSFPLKSQLWAGRVTVSSKEVPENFDRSFTLTLRKNGLFATSKDLAKYLLSAEVLSYGLKKKSDELFAGKFYYSHIRYELKERETENTIRKWDLVTTFDPKSYKNGVLVSCEKCDLHKISSRRKRKEKEIKGRSEVGGAPSTSGSNSRSDTFDIDGRKIGGELGKIAALTILSIATGQNFVGSYQPSTQSPYDQWNAAKKNSVNRAKVVKLSLREIVEILADENL